MIPQSLAHLQIGDVIFSKHKYGYVGGYPIVGFDELSCIIKLPKSDNLHHWYLVDLMKDINHLETIYAPRKKIEVNQIWTSKQLSGYHILITSINEETKRFEYKVISSKDNLYPMPPSQYKFLLEGYDFISYYIPGTISLDSYCLENRKGLML